MTEIVLATKQFDTRQWLLDLKIFFSVFEAQFLQRQQMLLNLPEADLEMLFWRYLRIYFSILSWLFSLR